MNHTLTKDENQSIFPLTDRSFKNDDFCLRKNIDVLEKLIDNDPCLVDDIAK